MNMQNFNGMAPNPMMNQMMLAGINPIMLRQQHMQELQKRNKEQMEILTNQNLDAQGQMRMSRILKEYNLCSEDLDLISIGCSFQLDKENDYNVWKVLMLGPQNTPYQFGLWTIKVIFPPEYPSKGAEFRFVNKIYHLNVDWKNKKTLGHICLSSLNEWATTGKVTEKPCYGVKQALFDIFCLFHQQRIESPYDEAIAKQYRDNRPQYDAMAKEWTEKFA